MCVRGRGRWFIHTIITVMSEVRGKEKVRSVVSMVTDMSAKGHGAPLFFRVRKHTNAHTQTHALQG